MTDKEGLAIIKQVDKMALKSVQEKLLKNVTLSDINRKTYQLKELIDDCPNKIILKFSETQCSYCVDHALNYIKKYEKKIGKKNIFLIGDFIDQHSFSVFVRWNLYR